MVSSRHDRAGEMVAMIHVLVLPPRESSSSLVSLLSLLVHWENGVNKVSPMG